MQSHRLTVVGNMTALLIITFYVDCRTSAFTSRLTSQVKLVGPTISCEGAWHLAGCISLQKAVQTCFQAGPCIL